MAVLEILHYPDPRLKEISEPVEKFDDELKSLVSDMVETMYAEEGVGLAAQQMDKAIMLCVIDISHLPDEELDYQLDGLRPPIDLLMPMALVNPVVKTLPSKTVWGEEGCLSFPGIRGDVPRVDQIQVTYQDLNGTPHSGHRRSRCPRRSYPQCGQMILELSGFSCNSMTRSMIKI